MKLTKETLKRIIKEELDIVMREGLSDRVYARIGGGIGALAGDGYESGKTKDAVFQAGMKVLALVQDLRADVDALGIEDTGTMIPDLFDIGKELVSEKGQNVSEGLGDRTGARIGGAVGALYGDDYEDSKKQDFMNQAFNRIGKLGYDLKNDEEKLGLPPGTLKAQEVLAVAVKLKKAFPMK
jgi:hypothetical protein